MLYYTNKKPHCTTKLNFSCSSCSSKEHKKSVTHAVQDCKKYGNHYLNSIEKKATCINCQNLAFIKSKTKATKKAISFVSEYIDALLQRELPYNISDKVYNMVFSHDHNIQTLYKCNAHNGTYRIKNKGTYYNEIDKILATHIFCALFTTKKL